MARCHRSIHDGRYVCIMALMARREYRHSGFAACCRPEAALELAINFQDTRTNCCSVTVLPH